MPSSPSIRSVSSTHTAPDGGSRPHPSEISLAVVAGLNLCFLPWAFGGVDLWSQVVSAGLGAIALGLALLPRSGRTDAATATSGADQRAWLRFARFPGFWAGAALLIYVGIQALNPAFDYHRSSTEWLLTRRSYLPWLPAGMNVPLTDAGPWRAFLFWFSPWALMCALWLGVTRRSVAAGLLIAIVANGFVLAAFGLVQRAGGGTKVLGVRPTIAGDFFASFIYKNHAAAFFNLVAMVASSLAIQALWRNRRHAVRHGPAILHFIFAVTLMLAVVVTTSLSGVALLAASLLVLVPVTAVRLRRTFPGSWPPGPGVPVAVVLVALVGIIGVSAGYDRLREKIEIKLAGEGRESARTRALAAQQGAAMFADRWLFGWGAGCFRYGFTKYQHEVPELTQRGTTRFFWEHVHNDWLELGIELGVVGLVPIAFIAGYWLRQIANRRVWRQPALSWILVGLGALAAHAAIDFPFQNPAILVTAGAVVPLLLRWSDAGTGIGAVPRS